MDYYKIGQQIRKYRKAHGMSQEYLAEQVGISVPHMSHIETGNTKLSLPVFAKIAEILDVPMDSLLSERPLERNISLDELAELLESCTTQQLQVIADIAKATKLAMDKHIK